MVQQITQGRIKLAEFSRNTHVAVAHQGVSLEDALSPVYWAHVASGIRPFDKIELRAEDNSWFADLIVFKATKLEVFARVLTAINSNGDSLSTHHATLTAPAVDAPAVPAGYVVDYGGPIHNYRVIRTADGAVLVYGLSQDEAVAWAIDHSGTKHMAKKAAPASPASITIPEAWRDLTWQERRSLASQLTDEPVKNGDDANAAIELELERRASGVAA